MRAFKNQFMKKIVCALAICLACVCCKKTKPEDGKTPEETVANFEVSFTGEFQNYASDEGVNTRESWIEGDKVLFIDRETNKYLGCLDAKVADNNDAIADFSGKIEKPAGMEICLLVSPALNEIDIAPGTEIPMVTCHLTNSGARNSFVAIATESKDNLTDGQQVTFEYATSLVSVSFEGIPAWQRIESVSMFTVPTSCQIKPYDMTVSSAHSGSITQTRRAITNSTGKYSIDIAVPVCGNTDVRFILNGSLINYSQKFAGMKFESGKAYKRTISLDGKYEVSGKLNGVFSVSPSQKVNFSRGNLRAATFDGWNHTCWDFYAHQYEINSLTERDRDNNVWDRTTTEDTEIDLFTWGCGNWSTNPAGADYYKSESQLAGNTDWGSQVLPAGRWRTLTKTEWRFLFTNVETRGAELAKLAKLSVFIYYGKNQFVNGVVLAPDGNTETIQSEYYLDDVEGEPKWSQAEQKYGFVFLPMAGERYPSNNVHGYSSTGVARYWSSTSSSSTMSSCLVVKNSSTIDSIIDTFSKGRGAAVRLVSDIK